jgi:hypothetical protein
MNMKKMIFQKIKGLMDGRLYVDASPAENTRLTEWLRLNAGKLGCTDASDLGRRRGGA